MAKSASIPATTNASTSSASQFYVSKDGGKTFNTGNAAKGTHGDYHALWIDPRDRNHLVLGCDGGLYYLLRPRHHLGAPQEPAGQPVLRRRRGYAHAVPVYGGLQDNGTWAGPSATRDSAGITFCRLVQRPRLRRLLLPGRSQRPRHRLLRGAIRQLRRVNSAPAPCGHHAAHRRQGDEDEHRPRSRQAPRLPLQLVEPDPAVAAQRQDRLLTAATTSSAPTIAATPGASSAPT